MSVATATPATPRRNVLLAHPQGVSTLPSLIAYAGTALDKSPSIRASRTYKQRAEDFPPISSASMQRPSLIHKQSNPLPAVLHTPVAPANDASRFNLMEPATAPPRLPVPPPSASSSSKRRRLDDSERDDTDAAQASYRLSDAIVNNTRQSTKRARHQQHIASPRPDISLAAAGTSFMGHQHAMGYDDESDGLEIVGGRTKPVSRGPIESQSQRQSTSLKRTRAMASPMKPAVAAKKAKVDPKAAKISDAKQAKLDQYEEKWKDKYTRAFPGFKFYFDSIDGPARSSLAARAQQLGARVEDFFSNNVTHFITNKPVPKPEDIRIPENKENAPNSNNTSTNSTAASGRSRGGPSTSTTAQPLRSPIKLRPGATSYDVLVSKAVQWDMKIWDEKKLETIFGRLIPSAPSAKAQVAAVTHTQPNLSYLLEAERHAGVTHERDPKAQRTDYVYFPRNTYWLLIEDMDGSHAPLAVKDYGRWKPKVKGANTKAVEKLKRLKRARAAVDEDEDTDDDDDLPPWPPLRDQRGRAKADWAYGKVTDSFDPVELAQDGLGDVELEIPQTDEDPIETDAEVVRPARPKAGAGKHLPYIHDSQTLRRTASMADIDRAIAINPYGTTITRPTARTRMGRRTRDVDDPDAEYLAASGNSVTITSHINSTTSHAYYPGGNEGLGPTNRQFEKRLHHQVLTRAAATGTGASAASASASNPPSAVGGVGMVRKSSVASLADAASARAGALRKTKSTNALRTRSGTVLGRGEGGGGGKARLPTREEVKKPGYCENCRVKFDDFTKHIAGKRHRRFAENDSNFAALDDVLKILTSRSTSPDIELINIENEEEVIVEDDGLEIVDEPLSDQQFFAEQYRRGVRQQRRRSFQQQKEFIGDTQSTNVSASTISADYRDMASQFLHVVDSDDPFIVR